MKKIIILIFSCILLTGCSAEYTLIYENDILKETLNITSNKEDIIDNQKFSDIIDEYYRNTIVLINYKEETGDLSEDEILKNYNIYNKKLIDNNSIYGINYNYDYNLKEDYENSTIVYNLYNNINVNEYSINTYDIQNIFNIYKSLNNITIKFKTDKKISSTNSDEEKEGIYYWYINKDNYSNKTIKIQFENNNNLVTKKEIDEETSLNITYTVLIVLLCGIVLTSIIIYIKIKNSNK